MSDQTPMKGQIVGRDSLISANELCDHCTVEIEEVVMLVREGILDPVEGPPRPEEAGAWRFHVSSVRRVRTVVRLQRDLGVNLPGAALALELLDRIEELRRRM